MYESLFRLHAQLLKALAHPRRLEIIHLLKEGPVMVCDMQKMLGLPQANLSQHLKVLRAAGAVSQVRHGKHREYHLAHPNFAQASQAIRAVLMDRRAGRGLAEFSRRINHLRPVFSDPVCGMRVSPHTAAAVSLHHGRRYYFCATGCQNRFNNQPKQYAGN